MSESRQRFMAALAKLAQPDNPEEASRALVAMLPMMSDISDRAFNSRECLNRTATAKRRTVVPSYADIRLALEGWEREQPRAIQSGEDSYLDDNARMWVAYFERREAEYFQGAPKGGLPPREHCLSLVKQQSSAAWAFIMGHVDEPRPEPTEEEIDGVKDAMATIRREMASGPTHRQSHSIATQLAAVRGHEAPQPSGALSPSMLASARVAAGIIAQ